SIVELKDYLDLLGYTIDEDAKDEQDIFTDELSELIKQYKKNNDLAVTGELDEELLTLIEIQVVTEYLDILGYTIDEDVKEDTNEDEDTFFEELSTLIEQYQEDNALEVTGELDEEVFELIEEQALALKEEMEATTESDEIDVDKENIDEDNESNEDIDQVEETEETEETEEAELKEDDKEEVVEEDATISDEKPAVYKVQATAIPTVLKKGMRHQKVKVLKADLKKVGFTVPGKGTTLYGTQTEKKVKEFQSYYGLTADGQAGPATFNKIDSIRKLPIQMRKRDNQVEELYRKSFELKFDKARNITTDYVYKLVDHFEDLHQEH